MKWTLNRRLTSSAEMSPVTRGLSTAAVAHGVAASSTECDLCHFGCSFLPPKEAQACHIACNLSPLCP
jgi:hypothetical protein